MAPENKTVKVTVDIKPKLSFKKYEGYPELGIKPVFDSNNNLVSLEVTLDVPYLFSNEEISRKVNTLIKPLIERLQYLLNRPLKTECRLFEQIYPPSPVKQGQISSNMSADIHKPIDMPVQEDILRQDDSTIKQLHFYNRSVKAQDVIQKIRDLYQVLEEEERRDGYKVPDDMKFTRDAVSHPACDSSKIKEFLRKNIGSETIDITNPDHISFLNAKLEEIRYEAKRIIDSHI